MLDYSIENFKKKEIKKTKKNIWLVYFIIFSITIYLNR